MCGVEGPWLMYDNERDPYQMGNLVNRPEHAGLQDRLHRLLQQELQRIGDPFLPKQHYLEKWGYTVNRGGEIPYTGAGTQKVQSPENRPGV